MPNEVEPEQKPAEEVAKDADAKFKHMSDTQLLIEALKAISTMLNEQLLVIARAIDAQSMMINEMMAGLQGGRQVNEARMVFYMKRIDVLEDTLRGKMELNHREVMAAVRVVENAAAQAVCRTWDRDKRPAAQVTANDHKADPVDYHDIPPGV